MANIRTAAISLAMIMILSTMSGFVYDDARQNNPFEPVSPKFAEEGHDNEEQHSALYDEYVCPISFGTADVTEICSEMFKLGEEHNDAARILGNSAVELGADFGHSSSRDLHMYDRIALNSKSSEIIKAYNDERSSIEAMLNQAAYNKIRDNQTDVLNYFEASNVVLNTMMDELDASCDEDIFDSCRAILNDVTAAISNMKQAIESRETDFLSHLEPSNADTPEAKAVLSLLHTFAYGTNQFWSCQSDISAADIYGWEDGCAGLARDHNGWHNAWIILKDVLKIAFAVLDAIKDFEDWDKFLKAVGDENWIEAATYFFKLIEAMVTAGEAIVAGLMSIWDLFFGDDDLPEPTPDEICNDGVDNDGDGLTDCDDPDCDGEPHCGPDQYIGNLSLTGPASVAKSSFDWSTGVVELCPYPYQTSLSGSSASLDASQLTYHWQIDTPNLLGGSTTGILTPQATDSDVAFWESGTYTLSVTVTHPYAVDSPQQVTKQVSTTTDCTTPDPTDPPTPVGPAVLMLTNNDCTTWHDCAAKDIGLMSHAAHLPNAMQCNAKDDGSDDMWSCYTSMSMAMTHNRFFADVMGAHNELELRTKVGNDKAISNIDAAVIYSDNPAHIGAYIENRDVSAEFVSVTNELSRQSENRGDSFTLLQMKAIHQIVKQDEGNAHVVGFLEGLIQNYNEDTIDEDYKKELEQIIASEDFNELPENIQFLYETQLAIWHAIDGLPDDAEALGRAPKWLKKVIDGLKILVGVGQVINDEPINGGASVVSGVGSLLNAAAGGGGSHTGFDGVDICASATMESCMRSRLVENDNFATERAAAASAGSVCGEDPSLTTITTAIPKVNYIAGDPVEWVITVNCAILGYEYQMKSEAILSSTGEVAYSEKTEIWEQANADYSHTLTFRVDVGLDAGEYCVNSILVEAFNPGVVASSSGADCFDVDQVKQGDPPIEDDGWPIPGFTGMTALVAMLGAAIIAFRRLEDQ